MNDESNAWQELAKYLWGLLVPAVWWLWNKQDKRMDQLEAAMKTKAEMVELDRQRDSLAKLFDVLREQGERSQAQFSELKDLLLETNVTLLRELNRKQDR